MIDPEHPPRRSRLSADRWERGAAWFARIRDEVEKQPDVLPANFPVEGLKNITPREAAPALSA